MAELHFESKEVEEYYRKERRVLGIGHPCRWDSQEVITKEDVDNYIKDAKNILSCQAERCPYTSLPTVFSHKKSFPPPLAESSFCMQKTAA